MATISYGASTELDAVNAILMSVGESPVNTLTAKSPEVAIAQLTLRLVCREVQAEGWKFNTETEYPLVLDDSKHAIVPQNVLQIDLNHFKHDDKYDLVRRNDDGTVKLYDLKHHRYDFEAMSAGDKLYVDIIWMIAFDDIPQVFRDYITIRACRIGCNRMVNDQVNAELIGTDEALSRATAVEYDTRQGDYNIFNDNRFSLNPASVYRPYQVLQRR